MDGMRPLQLLPTLPILAESLTRAGWNCEMVLSDEHQSYRGIRLYHRKQQLQKDVLYLLRPTETDFPFDDYSYLSAGPHSGKANHLICPERPDEEILDQLLEVFSQFRNWEEAMDLLLYRSAGLQELCDLGAQLLENPVCIHDDWFVVMAATSEFSTIMEPEYLMSSSQGFVPRAVVEDFLYDSDYLETYTHHDSRIWHSPEHPDTLYANLWDGPLYKGRLLVTPLNRGFLERDFLLTEALAHRAAMLLRRKPLGSGDIHRNMDDIVFSLLEGSQTEPVDLNYMMDMLHWQKTDRFVCLRLKPQQSSAAMMNHVLHSDLFHHFPGSYILMGTQEQCVIVNLSQSGISPWQLRHQLSPLCRDYCLYAGISSPVNEIRELNAAYSQAGAALEHAFRLRGEKWVISFGECALTHITRNLPPPLTSAHLVAPEIRALIQYDKEKGTQYFDTLREYLLQERDISRTSAALIIHRTTLLYRLKKIRSLIPVNLEDPWQRLYLTLSLWILASDDSK